MHCSLFNALQNMRVYLFFLLSNQNPSTTHTHIRYTVFSSNHNLHKSLHGISFWASDPFWKIYQLKCLNPINKDHAKFYECCELMKKVYLTYIQKKNGPFILNYKINWPYVRSDCFGSSSGLLPLFDGLNWICCATLSQVREFLGSAFLYYWFNNIVHFCKS